MPAFGPATAAVAPGRGALILRWFIIVGGVILIGAGIFRFFAGSAAGFDCDDVAREAKRISQDQPVRLVEITDVEEVSYKYGRGSSERRCTGRATGDNGAVATVYMRGYDEGSNVMVSYSDTGF